MSINKCDRCGRELVNADQQYGWRCAKIVGATMSENQKIDREEKYIEELMAVANKSELYSKVKWTFPVSPITGGVKVGAELGLAFAIPRTDVHDEIVDISKQYDIKYPPTWTLVNIAAWQLTDSDAEGEYIRKFKLAWISAYKDGTNGYGPRILVNKSDIMEALK